MTRATAVPEALDEAQRCGIISKGGLKALTDILVTLNSGYLDPLCVMLRSLCINNPLTHIRVFVAHISLTEKDFALIESVVKPYDCEIVNVRVDESRFPDLPFNYRWPKEACLRIFAAHFLPESLERVLYLDPDIVVIKDIGDFYSMDLGDHLLAACTHHFEVFKLLGRHRLRMSKGSVYINSGVLLMNLEALRREQKIQDVYDYVEKNSRKLYLFDQDILNGLYHTRTLAVNTLLYNLDERYFKFYNAFQTDKKRRIDLNWVADNTVIVHFCGKVKPWDPGYKGKFGERFYLPYARSGAKELTRDLKGI